MTMTFNESLREGQAYEERVAHLLERLGWKVIRTGANNKGLDLIISKGSLVYWVDVKMQTNSSRGQTGIRKEHYEKYRRIQAETHLPVMLIMVILTGEHMGVWRMFLATPIDHEAISSDRWGPCRKVYWNMEDFHLMGSLDIIP